MVRELGQYDRDRYGLILRWPVEEALAAFEWRLKSRAREDYAVAVLAWASLAATGATKKKRPPELPAILRS